jgi:hydrocephalus-inducing protein
MSLLGKCVPQPKESVQDLVFETVVRNLTKSKVVLKNPSPKPWKIKVSISTTLEHCKGYFEGKDTLEVPASGQADFEVFYKPLTMTKNAQVPDIKDETHEGNLFFPLPDGTAIMYNLIGRSKPPEPSGTQDIQIKVQDKR